MIEGRRIEPDGVVVTLDFTRSSAPAIASGLFASPRATTSSKHPGRVNRGVIYTAKAQIEPCLHCGRLRRHWPGAHSPHHGEDPEQIVDCIGRPCVRGADGYHHVERGEA